MPVFLAATFALSILSFLFLPTVYCKYISKQSICPKDELGQQAIMLTFDDGPDSIYTDKILDLLKEQKVKATFFLVVEKAMEQKDTVKRIIDEGHVIGFHGLQHHNMAYKGLFATKKNFEVGLRELDQLCCSACPDYSPTAYYRPPFGFFNPITTYFIKKNQLTPVFWNVITKDWSGKSDADSILMRLNQGLKDGAIILLHDSGEGTGGAPAAPENTLLALKKFIPNAKGKGYQFLLPQDGYFVSERAIRKKGNSEKKKGVQLHEYVS